jgi:hypothetical protein
VFSVYLQQINVGSLQPLQTLVHAVHDVTTTEPHSVGVAGVHVHAHFGGDHETVPLLPGTFQTTHVQSSVFVSLLGFIISIIFIVLFIDSFID